MIIDLMNISPNQKGGYHWPKESKHWSAVRLQIVNLGSTQMLMNEKIGD